MNTSCSNSVDIRKEVVSAINVIVGVECHIRTGGLRQCCIIGDKVERLGVLSSLFLRAKNLVSFSKLSYDGVLSRYFVTLRDNLDEVIKLIEEGGLEPDLIESIKQAAARLLIVGENKEEVKCELPSMVLDDVTVMMTLKQRARDIEQECLKLEIEKLNAGTFELTAEGAVGTRAMDAYRQITRGSSTEPMSQAALIDQFARDVDRIIWCFEDEFEILSIYRGKDILDDLKNKISKGCSNSEEANEIKAFCNQTIGNAIMMGNGAFSEEIKQHIPFVRVAKMLDTEGFPLALLLIKELTMTFSLNFEKISFQVRCEMLVNENKQPAVVGNIEVIWDRKEDRLIFRPMYDVKVQESCSYQEMKILHSVLIGNAPKAYT
ncbi:MAG: hypothetical protein P4L16_06960 [Chlamydiales bacterium]|nr:hypothetical protein [Chlamydiales bacterium]